MPRIAVILVIAGSGAYIASRDPQTLAPFVLGVAWAIAAGLRSGPSASLGGTVTRGLAVEWALALGVLAEPGMAQNRFIARYVSIVGPELIMGLSTGMVSGLGLGLATDFRQLILDGLAGISRGWRAGRGVAIVTGVVVTALGLIISSADHSLDLVTTTESLIAGLLAGLVVGLIVGILQASLKALRIAIIFIIVALPVPRSIASVASTGASSQNLSLGLTIVLDIAGLVVGAEIGSQLGARLKPSLEIFRNVMPYIRPMGLPVAGFTTGYVTLSLWFASAFAPVNMLDRGPFVMLDLKTGNFLLTPNELGSFGDFLYFSMTTNPPLGYSEIRPVSAVVRILETLESISGTGWIVIVFAAILAYLSPVFDAIAKQKSGEKATEVRPQERHGEKANGSTHPPPEATPIVPTFSGIIAMPSAGAGMEEATP
jgi:hypothetical protein